MVCLVCVYSLTSVHIINIGWAFFFLVHLVNPGPHPVCQHVDSAQASRLCGGGESGFSSSLDLSLCQSQCQGLDGICSSQPFLHRKQKHRAAWCFTGRPWHGWSGIQTGGSCEVSSVWLSFRTGYIQGHLQIKWYHYKLLFLSSTWGRVSQKLLN